jgi:UDP-2,3-diacylglucosamine pyrophosphatase LpxH
MPEKTLIFSDSHLTAGENPTVKIFKKLCTDIAPKYDQVFILGDLFIPG